MRDTRHDTNDSDHDDETLEAVRLMMELETGAPDESGSRPGRDSPVAKSNASGATAESNPAHPDMSNAVMSNPRDRNEASPSRSRRKARPRGREALPDLADPQEKPTQIHHETVPPSPPPRAQRPESVPVPGPVTHSIDPGPIDPGPIDPSQIDPNLIDPGAIDHGALDIAEFDIAEADVARETDPELAAAAPLVRRLIVRLPPWLRPAALRLAAFRPTRKQIAAVALIAVMIWRPWLLPGLAFLSFWIALIVYFTLGPDRVSEIVVALWERYERLRPESAARRLAAIQRLADRADGWLARLPERWTDGIYLPDLGRSHAEGDPTEGKEDPFQRLASERAEMVPPAATRQA